MCLPRVRTDSQYERKSSWGYDAAIAHEILHNNLHYERQTWLGITRADRLWPDNPSLAVSHLGAAAEGGSTRHANRSMSHSCPFHGKLIGGQSPDAGAGCLRDSLSEPRWWSREQLSLESRRQLSRLLFPTFRIIVPRSHGGGLFISIRGDCAVREETSLKVFLLRGMCSFISSNKTYALT